METFTNPTTDISQLRIKIVDKDENELIIIDEFTNKWNEFEIPEEIYSLEPLEQYKLVFNCVHARLKKIQKDYHWFSYKTITMEDFRIGFSETEYENARDYNSLIYECEDEHNILFRIIPDD